ncbi:MAG TPA: DUF262 domain-containing protein [Herpetosiphonaceae bacterium]
MSIANNYVDEMLIMALEALVEQDQDLSLYELVQTIGRRREQPLGEDEQDRLELLLRRDGAAYVRPPERAGGEWSATIQGRILVQQRSTDDEVQSADDALVPGGAEAAAPDGDISSPFNPTLIRVDQEQMPLYHALRLIEKKRIVLDPEFQRNFIWDKTRQSRLIESVLLRIPLPAFYLDATRESTYLVIDGRQRLTTLNKFCNEQELRLTGLEYLKDLEGKTFDELPLNLQTTLTERTRLTVYTIQPETPDQVKFLIFSRVNTGGLTLTGQEIRHALYQGPATQTLNELARSPEFLEATANSVRHIRMEDRECVLRFLAFHFNPYDEFGTRFSPEEPSTLDGLLNRTMGQLNDLSAFALDQTKDIFYESMVKARRIFGHYAFRKLYDRRDKRLPISKPLFEVWGVLLRDYALEDLEKRREAILDGFIDVMTGDIDFVNAISYGTGSPASVKYRFQRIQRLLQEVML